MDILGTLKGGAYDLADQSHYLKLFLLLYIHKHNFVQNLEEYSLKAPNSEENTKELKYIFETFFSFFRTEFYPEKFISLFEDTFDTDSISNVNHLI